MYTGIVSILGDHPITPQDFPEVLSHFQEIPTVFIPHSVLWVQGGKYLMEKTLDKHFICFWSHPFVVLSLCDYNKIIQIEIELVRRLKGE